MVEEKESLNNVRLGLRNEQDFEIWKKSPCGQYVQVHYQQGDELKEKNLVFFDMEFDYIGGCIRCPKLVTWYERYPPRGVKKRGVATYNDEVAVQAFEDAVNRADKIVAYNPWVFDYPALSWWGIDADPLMMKTIDLYEFVFKSLSCPSMGNLSVVSQLNGGPAKTERTGSSMVDFQQQCERDLRMLMNLFWKVLSGRFVCSRFGMVDLSTVWRVVDVKSARSHKTRSSNPEEVVKEVCEARHIEPVPGSRPRGCPV